MSVRRNNNQGANNITWGFLGKRKKYVNNAFKRVPEKTEEERRQELIESKNSWSVSKTKNRIDFSRPEEDMARGGTDVFAPPVSPTPSVTPSVTPTMTPTITPTMTMTPTPSPILYYVDIAPTSSVQYQNTILSASTTLTSPTFIWTLTDFYDTTDTQVTSYTGSVLTEGYFTSTGSSNVVVVATGDEGSATGSTFSVTEYTPEEVSGLMYWIDPSNTSSVTTRTSGSDVYVESIDNLATGYSSTYSGVSNSVAIEQPYLVNSTGLTSGLPVIMNTGFRSTYTTSLKDLGNVVSGDTFTFLRVGYHGVSNHYYAFQKVGLTSTANRVYLEETGPTSPTNDDLRIRYRQAGSFRTTYKSLFWNTSYSNTALTYGFIWKNNGVDPWLFDAYIDGTQFTGWTSVNTTAPATGFPDGYNTNFFDHVLNASAGGQTWDGYEELGEWVAYNRELSQSEITEINRYLSYKWGV